MLLQYKYHCITRLKFTMVSFFGANYPNGRNKSALWRDVLGASHLARHFGTASARGIARTRPAFMASFFPPVRCGGKPLVITWDSKSVLFRGHCGPLRRGRSTGAGSMAGFTVKPWNLEVTVYR